ncbi:MAG: hypothetical protein JSS81_09635 [Acidobacteria bacterium]|nr:hypothetical protein [Acidobacteriota bacterium]
MKNYLFLTRFTELFILVNIVVFFSTIGFGQCKDDITIQSVFRDPTDPASLAVRLNTPKGVSSQQKSIIENSQNWLVFNPDALGQAATATPNQQRQILNDAVLQIDKVSIQRSLETNPTLIEVKITLKMGLLEKVNYLVQVKQLSSPKCLQSPTLLKPIDASGKKTASKTKFVKSKDRATSDIYVQGLAEGARKQKTFFSVDALLKRRFSFGHNNYIEPVFELKTSTSPKADPDSASLGINYVKTIGIKTNSSPLSSFDFTNGIKLESDTDFKNVNYVYQTRADLVFRDLSFIVANQPVDIIPFIGFELGRNIKSPIDEAKKRLIARPFFGANIYFQIYQNDDKVFSFETQYTRRLLLKREVFFKTNDNGSFDAIQINTKPRDYVKSSFNFDFSKNFGFSASYEYGQLPPKFTLVNSKFSFGLLFKGKFGKEE